MSNLQAIDVIIAARNEQKHIGRCLNALRNLDYPQELITIWVIDNSDDNATIEVAQSYDVKIVKCPISSASVARNLGLKSSKAELVAFLDAHCLPDKNWASSMTKVFEDEHVGGCQGDIISQFDSTILKQLVSDKQLVGDEHSIDNITNSAQSQALIRKTLGASCSAYPFILTGNSMFRRHVLEQAGFFDEGLKYLEDVDLSWKTVLLGYRLVYAQNASVLHLAPHSVRSYLKKVIGESRACAQLTYRYQVEKIRVGEHFLTIDEPLACMRLIRLLGFLCESLKLWLFKSSRPSLHKYTPVNKHFRSSFAWASDKQLKLSSEIIFWTGGEERSIVVNTSTKTRYVMDGPADFFFRKITERNSRKSILEDAADRYDASADSLASDLDSFVSNLIAEKIV